MALRTHYDNLQVSRTASDAVIRAAYRQLVQLHHPDKHGGDPEKIRISRLINRSYEVLSDPEKRRAHDEWIRRMEAEEVRKDTASAASGSSYRHDAGASTGSSYSTQSGAYQRETWRRPPPSSTEPKRAMTWLRAIRDPSLPNDDGALSLPRIAVYVMGFLVAVLFGLSVLNNGNGSAVESDSTAPTEVAVEPAPVTVTPSYEEFTPPTETYTPEFVSPTTQPPISSSPPRIDNSSVPSLESTFGRDNTGELFGPPEFTPIGNVNGRTVYLMKENVVRRPPLVAFWTVIDEGLAPSGEQQVQMLNSIVNCTNGTAAAVTQLRMIGEKSTVEFQVPWDQLEFNRIEADSGFERAGTSLCY